MERNVYLNLLHKILYCFKFRNSEQFTEYLDVVFSPLYVELFKEIKKSIMELDSGSFLNAEQANISQHPQEYERIKAIIKGAEFDKDLPVETKEELLSIVIFPYVIDESEKEYFLSLF